MVFDVDVRGTGARVHWILVSDLREVSIIYFVRWMDVLGTLAKSQTNNENSKLSPDKIYLFYEEITKFRLNTFCEHLKTFSPEALAPH